MILALILAVAGTQHSLPLIDEMVTVPAADWTAVRIPLRQQSARFECGFWLVHGSGVRVMLMEQGEFERLNDGQGYRALAATGYQPTGGFSYPAPPGDYVLVVDNRMEGRGQAQVRLQVTLVLGSGRAQAKTLSPERQAVVISLSVLFFAAVLLFAGRRVAEAFKTRPRLPDPPFEG